MNHLLGAQFQSTILDATGASGLQVKGVIQELWSGYGQILRISLTGGNRDTVVAKHVAMPFGQSHPRGWNSNLSHERKVFSYQVETEWYRSWSSRCDDRCRIPGFLTFARDSGNVLLVLEDLDASGFPARLSRVRQEQIELCLTWLAEFHATFMGVEPQGLWNTGTYWHLETRPEELDALEDEPLKRAAAAIDHKLSAARFQSLVHGDAKLANFCFSSAADRVATLDFQYVGGGCGMKSQKYRPELMTTMEHLACWSNPKAIRIADRDEETPPTGILAEAMGAPLLDRSSRDHLHPAIHLRTGRRPRLHDGPGGCRGRLGTPPGGAVQRR